MPKQDNDKFMLRLPDQMRDRIKKAAKANLRSMNAEIVLQLQRAYGADETTGEGLIATPPVVSRDNPALAGGIINPRP